MNLRVCYDFFVKKKKTNHTYLESTLQASTLDLR